MIWVVLGILCLLIMAGVPVGFTLMITATICMLMTGIDLIMVPIQMFSGTNSVVLLAIPLFIFMGELMGATSISERIINLASSMVGWMRGGLGHINVLTSMFMAEMSGSAVADAAVMSKVFVPQMERKGFPKEFAAAVTATSATLGIIIPPSIPMVLYGVTSNQSIKDLFIAGIVPGIILGLAFMVVIYIFAYKENHPVDSAFRFSHLVAAFTAAIVPLMIPVIVVGGLIMGLVTPTEAAAVGVIAALFFGTILKNDLTWKKLGTIINATVKQTSLVMMIIAGSAVLGQFLANEQLPQLIAKSIGSVSDEPWVLLLVINVFLLLLGMVLHASAAIIVVVPMLLPLAHQIGVDPIHFGVIVCLNLGIGQQTPPVASVLLAVCSTTGIKVNEVMRYGKWFILAMFVTLMIVSFVPATALWFR
ncbi:TRAP transporter large permease [Vibrio ruber]|uniref:TRAP transporter large permease protein n=1 Tax=Vibrio ruber (strain DSM 16370 / JCM 11486 / BCRC 17186 / CECT 7878 / LMG 23124 / VR1) TaxID=1123498 RepID=A0A1R4LEF1_VIBR1|nr:TRAP transporter large permease [Vibrio ruber]WNJ94604.1 TRAP transporter large permease [Vibrio ruber]SJN54936.1 Sialic acid TRAP transporter permease protein SiaT [Vibrio ruber DSM 16370]